MLASGTPVPAIARLVAAEPTRHRARGWRREGGGRQHGATGALIASWMRAW
jgi:hypothetical protein